MEVFRDGGFFSALDCEWSYSWVFQNQTFSTKEVCVYLVIRRNCGVLMLNPLAISSSRPFHFKPFCWIYVVTLNPNGGKETTVFTLCERSGLSRVRVKSSSRLKFKAILWVLL